MPVGWEERGKEQGERGWVWRHEYIYLGAELQPLAKGILIFRERRSETVKRAERQRQ